MRTLTLLTSVSFIIRSVQPDAISGPVAEVEPRLYSPYHQPFVRHQPILLLKRQSCPADHISCTNLNAPDACCPSGTNCAHDQNGNIACCPVNNYCTGIIGGSAPPSTSGSPSTSVSSTGSEISSTGMAVGTVTVTSTAGMTAGSSTAPASITGSAAGGGSTIPNAYYPFVYIPTSFGNAAVCSSYYSSCQAQSTSCFNSLAGANGVTINGMGGGTTQVGSTGILQASASSICSSLSQTACYGLQSTQCQQFGTAGATGSFVQIAQGPRETGCLGRVYIAAAGAAVGVMGMVA